jgi:NTP pyrophosphatase (non-canonical NTP hydrolase)
VDLQTLLNMQREFDQQHGWSLDNVTPHRRLDVFEREIIGLIGEVGELANLVKKARLDVDRFVSATEAFNQITADMKEELVNIFIYLLRLFQLTETDIAAEYEKKVNYHRQRRW